MKGKFKKVKYFSLFICCLALLACSENNTDSTVKETRVLSPERVVKLSVDASLSGDYATVYTFKSKTLKEKQSQETFVRSQSTQPKSPALNPESLKKWTRFTLETLERDEVSARVLVKLSVPDTAEIERKHGPINAEKTRELGFDVAQFNPQSERLRLYEALIKKHYPEGTGIPMSTERQELQLRREADGWRITQP